MTRQKSTEHYKCRRMQGAAGSNGRPSTVHVECLNVCLWAEGLHTRSHPRNPIFPVRNCTAPFRPLRWTRSHCICQHNPQIHDALVQYRHEFKSSVTVQIGILHSLSQPTISTSPLLWNRRSPTFCFSDEEVEMSVRKWLLLTSPTSTAKFLNSCQDGKKSISVVGDYVGK